LPHRPPTSLPTTGCLDFQQQDCYILFAVGSCLDRWDHLTLPFQSGRLFGTRFAFFRPSPLLRWLLLGRLDGFFFRLLTRFDDGRVTADIPHDLIFVALGNQRFMHTLRQGAGSKFPKGSRERPFLGNIALAFPTANPAQFLVRCEPIQEHARSGHVVDLLGDEGPCDRGAIFRRTSKITAPLGQELLLSAPLEKDKSDT